MSFAAYHFLRGRVTISMILARILSSPSRFRSGELLLIARTSVVPRASISSIFYSPVCVASRTNIVHVRYLRSRSHDGPSQSGESEQTKESSDPGKESEGNSKGEEEKPNRKVDPELVKKLRLYVLAVGTMSFLLSFYMMSQMASNDRVHSSEVANAPTVELDEFLEFYLKAGEVKSLLFVANENKAVAFIQEGAVIKGDRLKLPAVTIPYDKDAQQFWADVREAEASLGIPLTQGVEIHYHQGWTTFRMLELLIGLTIIFWLGAQYGRLIRKRILEERAKKAGK